MIIYWYDGQLINSGTLELAIDDPGLLYGATVFTTLRVYDNSLDSKLTQWDAHCDRLKFSLQHFGWSLPDEGRLRQGAELIMKQFPVLRITIFPDGREWITGRQLPPDLKQKQATGIVASLAIPELQRCLPTHKTGNYLSPWLAKIDAQKLNAQETILVDPSGNWLETSTGNLWGWGYGCWWTPPLTAGILPGIMREQLFHWLQSQQQQVQQEPWTKELVQGLSAIAYSNSIIEIIPIHTVIHPSGSLKYNSEHSILQLLREMF
ncbi:MAG: aminotransferase class IV [Calothrix sp. MO_167.B12]|nr:aminotransferase class IV [Calothrix sp. MO_167.B12]